MRWELRPLGPWIGPVTSDRAGSHRFRAAWDDTLGLLARETEHLGAQVVVVQVDVLAGDIRRDGMLRANAKVGFPGVRVSFDSRYGPLTYATDAYEQQAGWAMPAWQANVRAIALALQALRAVDRYGVTRTGEQYRGWAAIEAGPTAGMTTDEAARVLARACGGEWTVEQILTDREARARAYRAAARLTHPDTGGDPAQFQHVTAARDLLDATIGGDS
jgi:hypothetical protein